MVCNRLRKLRRVGFGERQRKEMRNAYFDRDGD
jgi:hypothetical protein